MPSIHTSVPRNITFYHIVKNASVTTSHWFRELVGLYTKENQFTEGVSVDINSGIFYLSEIKKDGHYTFTVVRNPWARIYDAHRDFTNSDDEIKDALKECNGWTEWPTFTQFVQNIQNFSVPQSENWNHDRSPATVQQTEYIDTDIDLVVQYENIENELKCIEELFGVNFPIEIDHSRDNEYREHYTEETKQIISKLFTDDIKKWNYTF